MFFSHLFALEGHRIINTTGFQVISRKKKFKSHLNSIKVLFKNSSIHYEQAHKRENKHMNESPISLHLMKGFPLLGEMIAK